MFTATVGALLLAASSLGGIHGGHGKDREACATCCEDRPEVFEQIARLQGGRGWIGRRRAARALRKYDWKCYPEAVESLANALRSDDCGLVRQEAAESLAKMKPCLPVAHEALASAAKCDKSMLTRLAAKKALRAFGKPCEAECTACGDMTTSPILSPMPGGLQVPAPAVEPFDSAVEPIPMPSQAVPRRPSATSPFGSQSTAPATSLDPAPGTDPRQAPALDMPALPEP